MFKAITRMFSPEPKTPPVVVPEILRLTIGRVAEIDPLLLRLLGADAKFNMPANTLEIAAQGLIKLEDGSYVHRFYTEQHVMIQVVSSERDGDEGVNDVTLFAPLDSLYPSSDAEFRVWLDKIRQTRFRLQDGTVYDRFWFDNSDLPQDPVQMLETVYDDRYGNETRQIHQTSMLYCRTLASGTNEMLMASIERQDRSERTVEMMVGVPLSPEQITA